MTLRNCFLAILWVLVFPANHTLAASFIGVKAALAGQYERASQECESAKGSDASVFEGAIKGLAKEFWRKEVPQARAHLERYLDCLELGARNSADPLVNFDLFRLNLHAQRTARAYSYFDKAEASGFRPERWDWWTAEVWSKRPDKNPKERLARIKSFAGDGNHWAQQILADVYGLEPVNKELASVAGRDDKEALKWTTELARNERNDLPKATKGRYQQDLGRINYNLATPGFEPTNSYCKEAVRLFMTGYENGDKRSANWLGELYSLGRCVKQDKEESALWYKRAGSLIRP